MNLRIFNWKVLSLSFIGIISFAPYLGAIGAKAIFYQDVSFESPQRVAYSEECSKLVGVPCSKGLIFNTVKTKTSSIYVPGLTASIPRALCLSHGIQKQITSEPFLGSNIAFDNDSILACNGDLLIYFRADLDAAYGSWILPYMISGNEAHIAAITRSVMFFRSELRTIFAGIVPFQVLLLLFLLSLLGTGTRYPYQYSFFTVSIMALVNGGVVEKALFLPATLFTPESKEFLGFLVLTIFSLESFKKVSTLRTYLTAVLISITLEFLCYNFHISKEIIWSGIIIGWGALTITTKFAFRTTTFFFLNCFYLLSVVTPYNLLPPYAGTLFFMVYFLGVQVEQIRLRLLTSRINQMSRKVGSTKELQALLKLIARVHHVERLSLSLVKNESFEHWSYIKNTHRPTKLSSQMTANVVSRVYASGKALVNVNANRDVLGKKLSNKNDTYKSHNFSSFPVQINGQMWGVLSFTDYTKSVLHQDAVKALHEVFLECSDIVAKALSQVTNRFASDFEKMFVDTLDAFKDTSMENRINDLLSVLYKTYGVSCYFSEISNDNVIKLLQASGTLSSLLSNINTKSFKVSSTNEFGPIALAFKENTPIVLQNWKPISDKISEAAADVYRRTDANSIITVPITLNIGDSEFRYLFWMQTDNQRIFNTDFHRVGKVIQTKLSHILEKQLSQFMSDSIFSLADSETIQNVVQGKDTTIKETGELVMFDLCKSTQLSISLGNDTFLRLSKNYQDLITEYLKPIGFKLQMVIGDALLFTRSEKNPVSRDLLVQKIYESEAALKSLISKFASDTYKEEEASLRVCSVFGDISRGLVKGNGGGWAITGATINEVHKIESVAKRFRNGIYFELDTQDNETRFDFVKTDVSAWSNGPTVKYLEYRPNLKKKLSA